MNTGILHSVLMLRVEQLLLSIVFQTRGGSFNQEEKRRHRLGQFGEMLWLPEPCYLGQMKLSVAGTHDALTSLGTRKPWSYSLLSLLSSSFLKPCNPLLLSQLCSTWAGTERNTLPHPLDNQVAACQWGMPGSKSVSSTGNPLIPRNIWNGLWESCS